MLSVTEFAALGLVLCFISSYVSPPHGFDSPLCWEFQLSGFCSPEHLSVQQCEASSCLPMNFPMF